jgi:integrase
MIFRRGRDEREHKTKRRPVVKLPGRLLAHLKRWRQLDMAEGARRRERDPDAPQITTVLHHGGLPITGKIRRGFAAIVRDAGLPEEITPHWMRHTCATWLMENEVEPWDAAAYTGMTVKTLETHYAHHRPTHQRKARRGVVGKLSGK